MQLEHPDITWCNKTGYPLWCQPEEDDREIYCDCCGGDIPDRVVYKDEDYSCLCKNCLLYLHRVER